MRKILIVCLLLVNFKNVHAQKVDTLYYDKDWKGVEIKEFASYVRYALYPKDTNAMKRFRDYYITGELQGEGGFISIDKNDDNKSVFDGEVIGYFKDGKKSVVYTMVNGLLHGRRIAYYENGNKQEELNYENGKCNGLLIEYFENGNKKVEMNIENGKPNGLQIQYFENGNKQVESYAINGVRNGITTVYKENGNVDYSCKMLNDKENGIFTKFFDDGISCSQVEMKDGEPVTPYYVYNNKEGVSFKAKLSDNTIYLETPNISQQKSFTKDGTTWEYYSTNGLFLAVTPLIQRDYGKYITLNIVLTNYAPDPIQINPESIIAFKTYKGKQDKLETLSSDDYSRRINRSQQWSSFFNSLGEGLAASGAGYSSSTSNTNTVYANNSYSSGVGAVVGTGGAALGAYSSNTTNLGVVNSTTTTASYNGAAAYQAQMIASQRINNYNAALNQERQVKEEGYLRQNTINSGETISGYVNVKYEKADKIEVYIDINTIKYPFSWSIPQ